MKNYNRSCVSERSADFPPLWFFFTDRVRRCLQNIVSLLLFVNSGFYASVEHSALSVSTVVHFTCISASESSDDSAGWPDQWEWVLQASFGKWIRLIIVPIAALILFYFLYLLGSPHFRKPTRK
jgi:hypothetical protein